MENIITLTTGYHNPRERYYYNLVYRIMYHNRDVISFQSHVGNSTYHLLETDIKAINQGTEVPYCAMIAGFTHIIHNQDIKLTRLVQDIGYRGETALKHVDFTKENIPRVLLNKDIRQAAKRKDIELIFEVDPTNETGLKIANSFMDALVQTS